MTIAPAVEIANAFLDAFTRQDLDAAARHLADDFAFDGPIAHYRSAREFVEGSRTFAQRLRPGWTKLAAFGDRDEALLLYDLTLVNGSEMRVADHYRIRNGLIAAESILWDTGRLAQTSAS